VSAPAAQALAPGVQTLETRVAELRQLFHALDPSPFGERDLDPRTEEFIVGWARETRSSAPLALVVRLDRPGTAEETALVPSAIRRYFESRALVTRRELRQLLRQGRISLVIGLAFVATAIVVGDLVFGDFRYGLVRESLVIGGWVALWRPLEIFLYDWWPIRAEAKLYDRLAAMPVRIDATGPGA
jgi:hypothetical protein